MLLETYENLLELYVKQLVFLVVSITINIASSISLWCVKNQMFMFVAKLGTFLIQQELSKAKSNLIPLKRQ